MEINKHVKMELLDNGQTNTPKAEQSYLLSSNNGVGDCSALGFTEKEPSIELLIDQFAEILVEAYFYEKRHSK